MVSLSVISSCQKAMGITTETVYPSESQMYCNTLVIAVNITDWINHNHNCSPFITHQTRSPKSQTAIASSTPKLERLFPQSKQSSLLTIHKPNCLFPKSNNRTFTTHKPDRLFPHPFTDHCHQRNFSFKTRITVYGSDNTL